MPRIDLKTRDAWLEYRTKGIGASDAPVILGISPWKSALQLYAEKLGLMSISKAETDYLKWGLRMEPVMAEAYAEETGRATYSDGPYNVFIHPTHDWMFCTLDRRVIDREKGQGVLEFKTAASFKHSEWKEGAPLMYQVQVQHQLAVTGLAWGAIAVLIGGNTFLHYDIQRDEQFIDKLIKAEQTFWERTCRGTAPDPDHSASAAAALGSLYNSPVANRVALPASLLEFDAQRQRGIELIEEGELKQTEAENHIKSALGNNVEGILPSGVVYTWKTQERNGKKFRVLRRRDRSS
jgi:putative phage-type endonuclease